MINSAASSAHRYAGQLRAVIFDWAGTVLDYGSRAPVLAVVRTFENAGVTVTVEEARGPMGMAKHDHIAAIFKLPRVREAWRNVHGREPGAEAVDQLYNAFLRTQTEFLIDNADLIPGCLETMAACRARGLALGSSTGYTAALMEAIIPVARRQGLLFDAVVCADDVPQGRPAPWMCLENARRLNVYPVEAIVTVDDTPVGIAAGLNAGMWTVGIVKSGNSVGLTEQEWDDAKVLIEALDSLQAKEGKSHRAAFEVAAAFLVDRETSIRKEALSEGNALAATETAIEDALSRLSDWAEVSKSPKKIAKGLKAAYRGGREAFRCAKEDPSMENLHEWRKQVKHLRHGLELLAPVRPKTFGSMVRQATELGDLLGSDHDLATLHDVMLRAKTAWCLGRSRRRFKKNASSFSQRSSTAARLFIASGRKSSSAA